MLTHPSVVRLFRLFEANGTAYNVLELVNGPTLGMWLSHLQRRPTKSEMCQYQGHDRDNDRTEWINMFQWVQAQSSLQTSSRVAKYISHIAMGDFMDDHREYKDDYREYRYGHSPSSLAETCQIDNV